MSYPQPNPNQPRHPYPYPINPNQPNVSTNQGQPPFAHPTQFPRPRYPNTQYSSTARYPGAEGHQPRGPIGNTMSGPPPPVGSESRGHLASSHPINSAMSAPPSRSGHPPPPSSSLSHLSGPPPPRGGGGGGDSYQPRGVSHPISTAPPGGLSGGASTSSHLASNTLSGPPPPRGGGGGGGGGSGNSYPPPTLSGPPIGGPGGGGLPPSSHPGAPMGPPPPSRPISSDSGPPRTGVTYSRQPGPPPVHASLSGPPPVMPAPSSQGSGGGGVYSTNLSGPPSMTRPPSSSTGLAQGGYSMPPPPSSGSAPPPGPRFSGPPPPGAGQYSGSAPPTASSSHQSLGPPPPPSTSQGSSGQSVFASGKRPKYPGMPTAAADSLESQAPAQMMSHPAPTAPSAAPSSVTSNFSQMKMQEQQQQQRQQRFMESFDLLQKRRVVPPYLPKMDNPDCGEKQNVDPELLCCTLNAFPETQSLLDKSRLPLGIHVHPFKDLPEEDLPVIYSGVILRCRSCRTYINPFVTFLDQRRWRCNVCFRVNEASDDIDCEISGGRYVPRTKRPDLRRSAVEYIAPSEYMMRPPQPTVLFFVLDVSSTAIETGYLSMVCQCLKESLKSLPGDSRTLIGFMAFSSTLHFFNLKAKLSQPQVMILSDVDDIFLPSPEGLLVNLRESRELVESLLDQLPSLYDKNSVAFDPKSALGPALQSSFKLLTAYGGRITVFQCNLPNWGAGQLKARETSADLSSKAKDVLHLDPITDFYKQLALECSSQQIAVDIFLLSSAYADLATTSCVSKFSSGCVYYYRNFHVANNPSIAKKFKVDFKRYLTRPIGFEAVMRIRCTRGVSLHSFHGHCFIRSTDLLSLPNTNPDHGFSMQLVVEESLKDIPEVCIQSALLYTTSRGERRIRIYTLVLPVTNRLGDMYSSANQHALLALLSKMAVDRSLTVSVGQAREALITALMDVVNAYRRTQPGSQHSSQLIVPTSLSLLALHVQSLLKHRAFRLSGGVPVDERSFAMTLLKCLPVLEHSRFIYPSLYPLHELDDEDIVISKNGSKYAPPVLQLSAEQVSRKGAYLVDNGQAIIVWIGRDISSDFCQEVMDKPMFAALPEAVAAFPEVDNPRSIAIRTFVRQLQNRGGAFSPSLMIIREDSRLKSLFFQHLVDDRTESAMSYYEFLVHIQKELKK
ncbi:protein transport protein Sec24A-like [Oscarella lobularis]|uniref:protein transport protein Sec24A-like n=1 Tax=Oscarella lobularis TaxID=121494 RepID=UPI003314325B